MPPRKKGKNPVQPTPSQGGDSEPECGDHSGLLSAMNKMMKSSLGELSGVLKNNQGSTSGAGTRKDRIQENPAMVADPEDEQEPQGGETDEITYLREFTRLQPPMFDGTKGPEDAECWLFMIKERLDVIRTPKKMRVKFATTRLAGNAHKWWRLIKQSERIRKWREFKDAFRLQFISYAFRWARRDELCGLVQGNMFIEEYRLTFEELSVYVDTFALSDQEKKEMFFQGLKEEYRCAMGFYEFPSYK